MGGAGDQVKQYARDQETVYWHGRSGNPGSGLAQPGDHIAGAGNARSRSVNNLSDAESMITVSDERLCACSVSRPDRVIHVGRCPKHGSQSYNQAQPDKRLASQHIGEIAR